MKIRALAVLTAAAGLGLAAAAAADSRAVVTLHWENATTGGADPITPGQVARVWISVAYEPQAGSPIPTVQGPGTLTGFGALNMRLDGFGGATGAWSEVARTAPWALGTFEALPDGTVARWEATVGFSPHPIPSTNPVPEVARAMWTPAEFSARTVEFRASRVGTGVSLVGQLASGAQAFHHVDESNIAWGSVRIPIIPAPGSAAMVALAGAAAAVRRRR